MGDKMKLKTFIIMGIVILMVFIIYLTTLDRKIYYLDFDINQYNYGIKVKEYIEKQGKLEKFTNNYTNKNDRTTDLLNNINLNKKIKQNGKKQTIKNALIKADLVTISTGLNDINYQFNNINEVYDQIDHAIKDIDQLLKLIRDYCKEDIILIGVINNYGSDYQELFEYMNNKLGEICYDEHIYFISPLEINNDPTKIPNLINKIVEKKILS